MLQELQQKTDNIEMDEKLRFIEGDNNILKIQLHKIKQKMKLQEELHKQETLELNKKLICIVKENKQLLLENLFMDKKLC
jgi:hypothetical protein